MASKFANMTLLSIFFWRCRVSLINFSYRSKFHANVITSFRVMIIFLYKGLTIYQEIGNTPVRVLLNIWKLGRVRNTENGRNVSDEILLNVAKCQGYRFYCFWVIKGKPTGGIKLPPPRLRLKEWLVSGMIEIFGRQSDKYCSMLSISSFHSFIPFSSIRRHFGNTSFFCFDLLTSSFVIFQVSVTLFWKSFNFFGSNVFLEPFFIFWNRFL